jgi:hypothetical protein
VVLVGNGNFDFRCYWRCEPNYVPPYMAYVSRERGEVAADNRFVTVSGDDIVPDMAIGRLPVSTPAEAAAVVEKILAYEEEPAPGDWNERALFVADNVPDPSGDFAAHVDELASSYLPLAYTASTIYLNDLCGEPTDPPTRCPAATAPITNAISDGALLATYVGHGSRDYWAHERAFEKEDVASLRNGGKLPVVLGMTCLTADFSLPEHSSLDGSMIRAADGGAVATWSCTTLAGWSGQRLLAQGFYTAVFDDEVREIGQAAVLGKEHLYQGSTSNRDLIDTFTLFGDPATGLSMPAFPTPRGRIYLPMVVRGS